jgi:hypothetical protein
MHLLNILQGRELLWSTSESALRVAIMETVSRCSAPPAPLPQQQGVSYLSSSHAASSFTHATGGDNDKRRLLLGAPSAASGSEEDFA